jgi:hypothetical protein
LRHRDAVIRSGTLDSLPRNGPMVTLLSVCRVGNKEGYDAAGMLAIVGALLAGVVVIVLGVLIAVTDSMQERLLGYCQYRLDDRVAAEYRLRFPLMFLVGGRAEPSTAARGVVEDRSLLSCVDDDLTNPRRLQ